ncbi:ABC transporter substrate-binding protein [Paracoccus onubensis]|uniref:ABC transporter substrate-binding protein n=1 Tax=Paracoccus onubensis TaxID=1675788 RepID=UPI0027315EA6|nr:ABC transporter substrate-binding protein [Paracoccus onubensis]MDP0929763.1 ABC transporter substrate-binding protein [Paracoccus onubensis]
MHILRTVLLVLATMLASPALAQGDRPLVITDTRGDRGMLAPYVHARNGIAYLYTSYVFDSLIAQNAKGELVPGLAESWTLSENGLTADLRLNPKASWHDGQPVTAQDAAFTFSYMAQNPYPFASIGNIDRAEAISDHHLRLTLKKRDAGLFSGLLLALPVLPRHIYSSQTDPGHFASPAAATGSGPYRLVEYDKAQGRYALKANPDYYRGKPLFDALMIVTMSDDAALQALNNGEVDVISYLPPERAGDAKAAGRQVVAARSGHVVKIGFNHEEMFADADMRQALAYALDRQAILDITSARGEAALADTGYFQSGSPWRENVADPAYAHDPGHAADLLEKQGLTRGASEKWQRDGVPVTLRLLADGAQARVAQVVTDQLEAFGFTVDLRLMEQAALQAVPTGGDYDLLISSTSTTGDPSDIANRVTGQSWNADRYHGDGRLDAILKEAGQSATPDERLTHLHEFQRLYARELPSLMLLDPVMATAHNDRVDLSFMPDGALIGIPTTIDKSAFVTE